MRKLFQEYAEGAWYTLIKFPRIWIISIAVLFSVGVNTSSEVVWKCATKEAKWLDHGDAIVFQDKMLEIEHRGKIYSSTDGAEWTYCCRPEPTVYTYNRNITYLVYNDELWILGGDGDC